MSDELSSLIKESFQLMNEKKYKSAIELLYPKLIDYPDNIEIIAQIGQCYLQMGEKTQAEEYYEKAFEIKNNDTIILDTLVEIKIEAEKFNEAETYIQYYLKCEDKVYATQKYLEALTQIKNFEEIKEFSKNVDVEILNSESLSLIANGLLENNSDDDLESAFSFAKKALELDKNNISAICAISKYYINKQDYEKVEDIIKPLSPKQFTPELLGIYGYKHYMTQNFEKAVACYSKALELDDKNEILYLNLAESYIQMGWLKEAEEIIKRGLSLYENSIKLRLSLSNIYYMNNEFDKTLLSLAFINEHEPDNVEMNLLYTYSYAHQNDFVKAQEYAKKLEGKVDSSFIDANLAKIYYNLGQKEKAFEKFDEAIKKDPENINILSDKVEYLIFDEDYDEAQRIYDKIIEINPNYVDAYYQKSVLYIYTKNDEEALKYAKKAVEMDCNNAEYQYNLAKIYSYFEEFDKALDCAKFSLSITPDDIEKYWFIGSIYLQKGEVEGALSYYKEILVINPNDFETLSRIAHNLIAYNQPHKAYEYFQKAFRVNPYDYDFVRDYSDFMVEFTTPFKGIKLLLNYKNFTDNKNLKIESKNRAKRIIRENKKKLSLKEKLQLIFI